MTAIDTLDDASIRFSLLDMDDVPRTVARTTVPALVAVPAHAAATPPVAAPRVETPATSPVAPLASNPLGIETWNPPPAPEPTAYQRPSRPLANDMPAPLRAGIEASRARPSVNRPVARTRAQIEREELADAQRAAREALDGAITIALGSENSGEFPHGCLVAWRPSGERRWEPVARAAESVGVRAPKPRSHKAVASEAVRSLACAGLRIETIVRGREWAVYRPTAVATVGATVGEARLVARLNGESLELDGPDDLTSTVRYAWDRARADATLGSAEITSWLVDILGSWRAVDTVHGRWIPPGALTQRWIALANALADIGMRIPRIPAEVSSRRNIRAQLADGLADEVTTMIETVATQRKHAQAEGRDLGTVAASNALNDIETLRAKLTLYEALTGPMQRSRQTLDTLAAELDGLANGTTQRGKLLEY